MKKCVKLMKKFRFKINKKDMMNSLLHVKEKRKVNQRKNVSIKIILKRIFECF